MKFALVIILSVALGACAQVSTPTTTKMDQLQETLEFNQFNSDLAINKAFKFVKDVKTRKPKAKFKLLYKVEASEFVDKFVAETERLEIPKKNLEVSVAESKQKKSIKLVASYVNIRDTDCGELSMFTKNDYKFGCVIEYNRNMSLANPIKSDSYD